MSRVINGDTKLKDAPEEIPRSRLDILLVEKYPDYNRSSLQKFTKLGYVSVDGKVIKKSNVKIPNDATINLDIPKTDKTIERPTVIFEDENVIVLNKPAGLLSMAKGEYCPESTLEDFGLLVHRLDRDTSGVVILAKNEPTQKMLRKQFQDRKTHKTYYAIIEGRPKLDEAMIDLPISRNLKHPTTFKVDPNGKPAQTHYKIIKTNNDFSLVELKPITGRTHQLRVHLKYLGTPILGDCVYGTGKKANRLFLHAGSLEITIPEGNRKVFTSNTPKEFNNVF